MPTILTIAFDFCDMLSTGKELWEAPRRLGRGEQRCIDRDHLLRGFPVPHQEYFCAIPTPCFSRDHRTSVASRRSTRLARGLDSIELRWLSGTRKFSRRRANLCLLRPAVPKGWRRSQRAEDVLCARQNARLKREKQGVGDNAGPETVEMRRRYRPR